MKIAIVYLFLILISCKNSNEKYVAIESNVTDSEIYEVVNLVLSNKEEAIKRDMIKGAESPFKYLLDKDSGKTFDKNDSIKIFTGDSIFSNKDLSFIQKQINSRKNFKFNKDSIQIKSLKIISGDTIRSLIENGLKNPTKNFHDLYFEKYGMHWFYIVSLPIFSKDKKTVFIKIDSFGSGQTMVYKKVNNHWQFYCSVSNWIA